MFVYYTSILRREGMLGAVVNPVLKSGLIPIVSYNCGIIFEKELMLKELDSTSISASIKLIDSMKTSELVTLRENCFELLKRNCTVIKYT